MSADNIDIVSGEIPLEDLVDTIYHHKGSPTELESVCARLLKEVVELKEVNSDLADRVLDLERAGQ